MGKSNTLSFALASFTLLAAITFNNNAFAKGDSDAKITSNKPSISGVYPHLAMWNSEGECGTGAVVPWAGKLWAITYGPHCVFKSDDRLYEIDENLNRTERKESLGGTHANRMIHTPSNQLIIGPYFIDQSATVRSIPRDIMPGRLTGNAADLSSPKDKVYFASMEEALYRVNVNTLEVEEIIRDGNLKAHPASSDANGNPVKVAQKSKLHGYHGKGLYSGFGKVFYANNGVHHPDVDKDPTLPSGALGEWKEGWNDWKPIRINQFTEITGPDGIYSSSNPDKTPIWSLGFDAKSVILMLCDDGKWTSFRLPKASHSYDGSHGWNTEWPRIREIGKPDEYLMTMHGAFWKFPPSFSKSDASGIRMRSNYLKVIGDFCKWKDKIVFGCDDSAQKEFFNTRDLKSEKVSPAQSNSNLLFMDEENIDRLGPSIARGSVFLREDAKAGVPSDPMLTGGFKTRILALAHSGDEEIEIDVQKSDGKGDFITFKTLKISPAGSAFIDISDEDAEWTRILPKADAKNFSAHFDMSNPDARTTKADAMFDSISRIGDKSSTAALLWGMGHGTRKLGAVAYADNDGKVEELGPYTLDYKLDLVSEVMPVNEKRIKETAYEPKGISFEKDSVLIIEDGKRYRLPINKKYSLKDAYGYPRVAREVATERDLMNCAGTFYELPARNAQGMAKIRPIASHNLAVFDYCSHRGLMFISGLKPDAQKIGGEHVITSADGKFSLWAGIIDDLWKLGKPVGRGSPWFEEPVESGTLSDPYILAGYDKKSAEIISEDDIEILVEIDIDGTGLWLPYQTLKLKAGEPLKKTFDATFKGYWVRLKALNPSKRITATFIYE